MHEKENIRERLLDAFGTIDGDNSGAITFDDPP